MRPTLEMSAHYIYEKLDLSMIQKKLVSKHYLGDRWFKKDLKLACKIYRNFLFISVKYFDSGIKLVPNEEIDEIWHNHILDHYPYFGLDNKSNSRDLKKDFLISQELYFKEFQEYY